MRTPTPRFAWQVAVVVLGVAGAIATVAWYLIAGGFVSTGDTYHLRAAMPTSSSLTPGARVTMAGAQVGRVTKVHLQGYATVVDMKLTDDSVAPVPADTRITLRQRTPVGENYIALTPGRSQVTLPENAVLPIRQADDYVDLDQILSVLRGRTKQQARNLIQSTGGALEGQGDDLNVVLGRTSHVVQSAAAIFETLHAGKQQTAQLVDHLGRLSAAVSERSAAIGTTADRGVVALRALASRDDALRRTLAVLPSTLAQVQKTSGTLKGASRAAAPVVANLTVALRRLDPAIADLEPAAATGRRVVAELGRASSPLRTTLSEATRLSAPLGAALPDLHKTLCQLNPMVRYIQPYARDLISPLMGLGSSSNSYDAIGHLIRLQPIVGDGSLAGLPAEVQAAEHTLLHSGLFVKGTEVAWNPYPGPRKIGSESAKRGGPNVAGPAELKKSGYVFPRIHADC